MESLEEAPTANAPISAHPAFPAIVALWFAALLGLGSLVLPVAVIERLVMLTHISSIIPAAEPPLGFTARAGIGLAASIGGTLLGLWLAHKVVASSVREPRPRSLSLGSERQCRPISARDELGDEGLDCEVPLASPLVQKRRSLAMADESRPSSYLLGVPLPGQSLNDTAALPISEGPAFTDAASAEAVEDASYEPLELGDFAEPDAEEPFVGSHPEDAFEALREQIHSPDPTATTPVPSAQPQRAADAPLPFAAPSLRRTSPEVFDEEEQADVTDDIEEYERFDDESSPDEATPQLTVVTSAGEAETEDRPVEELGLVQLAARLGASLEKRRAWLAERQAAAPAAALAPAPFGDVENFEAAGADEAARAMADFFGATGVHREAAVAEDVAASRSDLAVSSLNPSDGIPAQLRGVSIEHDEEDGDDPLGASFSLPLGGYSEPIENAPAEADEFDEEEPDDSEFSSLLAMKNPFAQPQEFVRVEEPEDETDSIEPVVTFPSAAATLPGNRQEHSVRSFARPFDPPQGPLETAVPPVSGAGVRDPGDAERSLRDALATLQRMSGAA